MLITIFVPPHLRREIDPDAPDPVDLPTRGEVLRPLLLVGAAVLVLTLVRTNRDLLLPLLGNEFGHSEAVISLVFAGSAVVELAFILPAGTVMDRFGRAAVLVPCLALMGVGYLIAPIAATVPGFVADLADLRRRQRAGRRDQQDPQRRHDPQQEPGRLARAVEQLHQRRSPGRAGADRCDRRRDGGHGQLRHRVAVTGRGRVGRLVAAPLRARPGEDQSKIGSTVRVRLSSKKPG